MSMYRAKDANGQEVRTIALSTHVTMLVAAAGAFLTVTMALIGYIAGQSSAVYAIKGELRDIKTEIVDEVKDIEIRVRALERERHVAPQSLGRGDNPPSVKPADAVLPANDLLLLSDIWATFDWERPERYYRGGPLRADFAKGD